MDDKMARVRELSRIIDDAETELSELLGMEPKQKRRRRTKAEMEAARADGKVQ